MPMFRQCPAIWFLGLLLTSGCGSGKQDMSPERLAQMAGGKMKAVVPVSGTVLVDGTPTAGVNLYLHKAEGGPSLTDCRTDKEGKYCWSTHLPCDGLEPGSYALSFAHIPKLKRNDTGVDLFKGKFRNPQKNGFKLTVEAGKPQTDVKYELKTK